MDNVASLKRANISTFLGWLLLLLGVNGFAYLVATSGGRTDALAGGHAPIPVLPILAALALVEGVLLLVPSRRPLD